jgi:hypothetical protein
MKTIGLKLTKDNFEDMIALWISGMNEDVVYIYNHNELTQASLAAFAWENNLVLRDEELSAPFRKVQLEGYVEEIL